MQMMHCKYNKIVCCYFTVNKVRIRCYFKGIFNQLYYSDRPPLWYWFNHFNQPFSKPYMIFLYNNDNRLGQDVVPGVVAIDKQCSALHAVEKASPGQNNVPELDRPRAWVPSIILDLRHKRHQNSGKLVTMQKGVRLHSNIKNSKGASCSSSVPEVISVSEATEYRVFLLFLGVLFSS